MSNRLRVYVNIGRDFERFRKMYAPGEIAARMAEGIRNGLDRATPIATSRVNRARFTGNGPFPVDAHRLGHRSRRLTRSLTHSPASVVDARTLSVRSGIGSNVAYFGAHEFGFEGAVNVPAHSREMPEVARVSSSGRQYKVPAHTQNVRAHSRTMRVPRRAPLFTGLSEDAVQEIYKREIYTGIMDEMNRGEIAKPLT
ncbi:MAG TPA: hypothetical protein PLA50_00330 [Bacteroidia bacterium]|nr:hypothetical protein [Bacteroidia bacterium]